MKVYCAETGDLRKYIMEKPSLPKFNILFSYYYQQNVEMYLPYAKSMIIDSGGFTFQTNAKKKDLSTDKFFKEYKGFIEKHNENPIIEGFFELDVDNLVGYSKVKEYREELFEITDKIIPVWHKSLGLEEYKNLCHEYDFIAIPCTGDRNVKEKAYGKFVAYAHKHNCKVHGLGMLRRRVLSKVPFDTCDGTTWFTTNRFGMLFNDKKLKVKSDYIRENRFNLLYVELMAHLKFQEEMYNKWRWYHND